MQPIVQLKPVLPSQVWGGVPVVPARARDRDAMHIIPACFGMQDTLPRRSEQGIHNGSLAPLHFSPPWLPQVDPRGLTYFTNSQNLVIALFDPQEPQNRERLQQAITQIESRFPAGDAGNRVHYIVLSLANSQFPEETVHYYLVDYSAKKICWVHTDGEVAGLLPDLNVEFRRSMLRSHYWDHVYHFPSVIPFDVEAERLQLLQRLRHMQFRGIVGDHGIPWSAEECMHFLRVLDGPGTGSQDFSVANIGRLNAVLARHQHSVRWDRNDNPRRFGGGNEPVVPVPHRRPAGNRPRMASNLLFSLVLLLVVSVWFGLRWIPALTDGSADRVTFIAVSLGSLEVLRNLLVLNHPRYLGLLLAMSNHPWLAYCLMLLAACDLGFFGLYLQHAARLLAQSNTSTLGYSLAGHTVLALITMPLLIMVVIASLMKLPH